MPHRSKARRAAAPLAAAVALSAASPAMAQENVSVFEMFFAPENVLGIIVTWLLILMSISVMALIIKHLMDNKTAAIMPPEAIADYEEMLRTKRFREAIQKAADDQSVFGQVMHASLSEAANGYGAMERAVEEQADLIGSKRVRAIELLSVLGAVGPMIGLFGTVYGMIVAFQTIVNQGGAPRPAELAGGISTALVTTFWGLIVGIPAVAAAALIRNKIDGLMVETIIQAELLIAPLSPSARKAQPVAGAASPKPRAKD